MRRCADGLVVRKPGLVPYEAAQAGMRAFTDARDENTPDEIWLLQHPPVFTQGQAGKAEHVLDAGDVPVVQSDRGGQVTYHGPGQVVGYTLIDIRRLDMGVRDLVTAIESAVIRLLAEYGIDGASRRSAPGVYVDGRKIAALGLRVRRGRSYHGVSLNVDMDLSPFEGINPCGYQGLEVTQLKDLGVDEDHAAVEDRLARHLARQFGYHDLTPKKGSGYIQ